MEISCGAYLIDIENNSILICRPTGSNVWSIPKGLNEGEESFYDTMVREVYEETGIDVNSLNIEKIIDLDPVKYKHKHKMLRPYAVYFDNDHSKFKLKCRSFFESNGKKLPEVCEFRWVDKKEANLLLHETQREYLDII